MSDELASSSAAVSPPPSDEPDFLLNAAIGAVVVVITAPLLPLAAIVGGAVAGYLQNGDLVTSTKVGALAGTFASIPAFLFAWFVVGFFLLGPSSLFAFSAPFALVLFVLVVGYLVGAGALGGALGAYVRTEL